MNFLDKLYESNYFSIGLFAVISFLVVAFLVVLFFGKRDEKKRKLESTKSIDTFKETAEPIKLDVMEPVMPTPIAPVEPVAPINYEEPVSMVETPIPSVPPAQPIKMETPVVEPIVAPVTGVINEAPMPTISNVVAPEPVKPVVMEPIKITIPEVTPVSSSTPEVVPNPVVMPDVMSVSDSNYTAPVTSTIREVSTPVVEPIIKEEVKPIVVEPTIIDIPPITDTYYNPIPKVEASNVSVPNIDFDELAKSISNELDELEKTTVTPTYSNIPVTPMNEINNNYPKIETVDLPKKIDLPNMKDTDINPENYNL